MTKTLIEDVIYQIRDARESILALGLPESSDLIKKLKEVEITISERYLRTEHEKEKGERTKL